MVDCHVHMVLDGGWWKDSIARHAKGADLLAVRRVLERCQKAGFTYLRDGGDKWGAGMAARELAPEYGITYRTPLSPLHKTGHYGGFIGTGFETEREFASLVVSHRDASADFIKIMVSGLMDFYHYGRLTEAPLPPKEIETLVRVATDEGMAVMVHGNGTEAVIAAARAGAGSVEHGAYLHPEALHAMAETGTVWVPTVSTVANPRGTGRFDDGVLTAILENTGENLRQFAALGGLIAPGSDAGAWAVPHAATTEHTLLAQILGSDTAAILRRGENAILQRF